jgi:K+ transporter
MLLFVHLFSSRSDSIVTPGVSVLSAVEGLAAVSPDLEAYCTPLALFFLSLLFYCQRFGSATLGKAFGPVMASFFLAMGYGTPLACCALSRLAQLCR